MRESSLRAPRVHTWFSQSGMHVREARFSPHERLAAHAHGHGYLCLVLGGSFHERWGGAETFAGMGTSCFLPAGTVHANTFSPDGAHCLRIELEDSIVGQLSESRVGIDEPWLRLGGTSSWAALRLYHACTDGWLTADALESLLAPMFPPALSEGMRKSGSRLRPSWLTRVRDALEVDDPVDRHTPPSLAALAEMAGVHRAHLARVFAAEYGCSIGEFAQTRKITAACRLLTRPESSLAQVAMDLGYHDQAHFTRAFRRRLGMTPGAWRHRANIIG